MMSSSICKRMPNNSLVYIDSNMRLVMVRTPLSDAGETHDMTANITKFINDTRDREFLWADRGNGFILSNGKQLVYANDFLSFIEINDDYVGPLETRADYSTLPEDILEVMRTGIIPKNGIADAFDGSYYSGLTVKPDRAFVLGSVLVTVNDSLRVSHRQTREHMSTIEYGVTTFVGYRIALVLTCLFRIILTTLVIVHGIINIVYRIILWIVDHGYGLLNGDWNMRTHRPWQVMEELKWSWLRITGYLFIPVHVGVSLAVGDDSGLLKNVFDNRRIQEALAGDRVVQVDHCDPIVALLTNTNRIIILKFGVYDLEITIWTPDNPVTHIHCLDEFIVCERENGRADIRYYARIASHLGISFEFDPFKRLDCGLK
jgi:hypothetical protein